MSAIISAPRGTDEYFGELNNDLHQQALLVSAVPRLVWNKRLAFEMLQVMRPDITEEAADLAIKRVRWLSCTILLKEQWCICEPARTDLLKRLYCQEPGNRIETIRTVVVKHAILGEKNGNENFFFSVESCYQLMMMPDQAESGFYRFAKLTKAVSAYRRQILIAEFLRLEKHFHSLGVSIPGWLYGLIGETPTRVIA
jgi:hypothetical protein